jgi:predicted Zn-dependent protease with MMP-like domain
VEPRRRTRDRRDRGLRGPAVQPRPGARLPRGSKREQFDALVLRVVTDVDERWSSRLGLVEYAVEDAPQVPDDWTGSVPLSSLVRGSGTRPTRLVLFRRPIEHRCDSRVELEGMVLTLVVEQVAELLGIEAHEVDPRYGREE